MPVLNLVTSPFYELLSLVYVLYGVASEAGNFYCMQGCISVNFTSGYLTCETDVNSYYLEMFNSLLKQLVKFLHE